MIDTKETNMIDTKKIALDFRLRKSAAVSKESIEKLRGLLHDSRPNYREVSEILRESGYDPVLMEYVYGLNKEGLVEISNWIFRRKSSDKRKDVLSFFNRVDHLGEDATGSVGKAIFSNCWKSYFIRYMEDKHRNVQHIRSFSYSFQKHSLRWTFVRPGTEVGRLKLVFPHAVSPLSLLTSVSMRYDPDAMEIVTHGVLDGESPQMERFFSVGLNSFENTFLRTERIALVLREEIYEPRNV